MDVTAALRRVKRQFGDEYNVVIFDQDIYDWIYDAELDIIRHTSDNDLRLQVPVNNFPLVVPDRVNIKRVAVEGKALSYSTVTELDLNGAYMNSKGGVRYWYFQSGTVGLWPEPEEADKYVVEVTYSKTPATMSVVAPYMRWVTNPAALQYAFVGSDDDWKNKTTVNVAVDMVLDSLNNDVRILTCGSGSVPGTVHFYIMYDADPANNTLIFVVSDGTTLSGHNLHFLNPLRLGDRFKYRITYNSTDNVATLYKTDFSTGVDVVQEVSDKAGTFNKQITAVAPLYIGSQDGTTLPVPAPSMRIYSVELRDSPDPTGSTVFLYDGSSDLANLPGIMSDFTTVSGHSVQSFGGVVVNAYNEFTVPEVYHEDVVKYCLARAHAKNQNFRASESEMEQYDRRVSTRRNEAQAIDAALYKVPDPMDYE